ncbi:hypothetical protein H312_00913 [Anncaliia algerae PRA339]|uniref:Uncharacterized protein n=1 Tax=Anncaliia algerae PRA339 TaxID=1288291 RepID=A0A059F3N9_9MICR|nr:hypothetical protein H312_00913 [Anncaliia algerae PRA339]
MLFGLFFESIFAKNREIVLEVFELFNCAIQEGLVFPPNMDVSYYPSGVRSLKLQINQFYNDMNFIACRDRTKIFDDTTFNQNLEQLIVSITDILNNYSYLYCENDELRKSSFDDYLAQIYDSLNIYDTKSISYDAILYILKLYLLALRKEGIKILDNQRFTLSY